MIPQYEPYVANYGQKLKDLIVSGWIGPGKKVEEFEQLISVLTGNKFVHCTNSGTSALFAASYVCKKFKKGNKILFPAYTFLAGLNAFKMNGFDFELVDVNQNTMCMDVNHLYSKLKNSNGEYAAVIFVNHNGYNGDDLRVVREMCDEYDVFMIEDSAQCFGIKKTSETGHMSILSFSVPKAITTGQGGAIMTKNSNISEYISQVIDHGGCNWRKTKIHKNPGLNLRMSDINAELGIAQIKDWNYINSSRKRVWSQYREEIDIKEVDGDWSWMVIHEASSCEEADRIIEDLKNNEIQGVKYYKPVGDNPCYDSGNKYPVALKLYENLVYLPSSILLTNEQIKNICKIVKRNKK